MATPTIGIKDRNRLVVKPANTACKWVKEAMQQSQLFIEKDVAAESDSLHTPEDDLYHLKKGVIYDMGKFLKNRPYRRYH